MTKQVQQLDRVIIRFAGDSGDGMQLAGDRFTQETATFGNDLSTLPNFPAEIRAPAGTLPGVSSFQLHFADHDILTPGDAPGRAGRDEPGGAEGEHGRCARAALTSSPTPTSSPSATCPRSATTRTRSRTARSTPTSVHAIPLTSVTVEGAGGLRHHPQGRRAGEEHVRARPAVLAVQPAGRGHAEVPRRAVQVPPEILAANKAAFQAGWNYGETTEAFSVQYEVKPAPLPHGTYRNITGNAALSYGLVAASRRSGLPLFLGSYPITPASDILHELSKLKRFGVRTLQAEDEISGVGAALGASFGGALGVTHHLRARHGAQGRDHRAGGRRSSCR